MQEKYNSWAAAQYRDKVGGVSFQTGSSISICTLTLRTRPLCLTGSVSLAAAQGTFPGRSVPSSAIFLLSTIPQCCGNLRTSPSPEVSLRNRNPMLTPRPARRRVRRSADGLVSLRPSSGMGCPFSSCLFPSDPEIPRRRLLRDRFLLAQPVQLGLSFIDPATPWIGQRVLL